MIIINACIPLETNKSYEIHVPSKFQLPPSVKTGDFIWLCNKTSMDLEFDAAPDEKVFLLNGASGSGFFLPSMSFTQFRAFASQSAWSEESAHPSGCVKTAEE